MMGERSSVEALERRGCNIVRIMKDGWKDSPSDRITLIEMRRRASKMSGDEEKAEEDDDNKEGEEREEKEEEEEELFFFNDVVDVDEHELSRLLEIAIVREQGNLLETEKEREKM
jgi:hypothetical protein